MWGKVVEQERGWSAQLAYEKSLVLLVGGWVSNSVKMAEVQ